MANCAGNPEEHEQAVKRAQEFAARYFPPEGPVIAAALIIAQLIAYVIFKSPA